MAMLIFITLITTIYNRCKNFKVSTFFSCMVMYFASRVFVARAQEISFLLFILEFLFIEKLLETNKKRYAVFLIIIPIVLANVHSSVYLVYFVFYLPYIVEYFLAKFKLNFKKIRIEKQEHIKTLFIVFAISLFTGFCTTTGFAPYTDMIKAMVGVSTSFIGELQTSNWYNNRVFYLVLVITTLIIIFGKQEVKITDIFYILGFSAMTIVTYRCVYFFLFIASIPIARIFVNFLEQNQINIEIKSIRIILYISLILLYILLMLVSFLRMQRDVYVEKDLYPVDATEYILNNLDIENIRIYNGFNWGSYLEFKGIKAFIDSRSGMFCNEFNPGVTILEDWLAIYNDKINHNEIFDKYNITHVLVQNIEELNKKVQNDMLWKQIYKDENFTLYARNID